MIYQKYIKRILDIIICVPALIILSPLFLIIAIAIKINDPGPVFYKGERIGKNCNMFKMIKFRSMYLKVEDIRNADGSTYNSENDKRVTSVGKFLRKSSLDELPQLINVIKGEMSFVGPRASTWDMLDTYKPDEIDKMKVSPGITGYCQAYYRNSKSAREKRLKDAWYANNVSFSLDVKILCKTVTTVVGQKSLYTD